MKEMDDITKKLMDDYRSAFKKMGELSKNPKSTAQEIISQKRAITQMAKNLGADDDRLKQISKKINDNITKARRGGKIIKSSFMDDVLKTGSKLVGRGSKLVNKLPGFGAIQAGLTAAMDSPSAAASEVIENVVDRFIPGGIQGLSPEKGSPGAILEDPSASPEARQKAHEMLKKDARKLALMQKTR